VESNDLSWSSRADDKFWTLISGLTLTLTVAMLAASKESTTLAMMLMELLS
jgi:hypothetical protein